MKASVEVLARVRGKHLRLVDAYSLLWLHGLNAFGD